MRVSYDPQDIQEIARQVAKEIMPLLLAEMRAVVKHQPNPVSKPEPPKAAIIPSAAGAVVARTGLKALTGLSPTTVWRMEKRGQFPRRVTLSSGRVGWMRAEIEAWLETRAVA